MRVEWYLVKDETLTIMGKEAGLNINVTVGTRR